MSSRSMELVSHRSMDRDWPNGCVKEIRGGELNSARVV
jgi:hypothetical protein